MLGRRAFLIGWIITVPALAKAWPLLVTSSQRQEPLGDSRLARPVLRIDGWETPFVLEPSPDGEVWISLNQSWRTAWR